MKPKKDKTLYDGFDKLLNKTKKLKNNKLIETNLNQLIIMLDQIINDKLVEIKVIKQK